MPINHALVEKQRQQAQDYVNEQLAYANYLNSQEHNPCIYEKQIGRSFSSEEFDKRLKKLNPDFITEQHPFKADKRCLYYVTAGGKEYITVFENGFIPEHSIHAAKTEEVWDGTHHINKKDLPKGEFVPGKGWIWDSPVAPGFKQIDIPWHETARGWRTVLCKIVEKGLASPYQVESIFGSDNTAGWKRGMGKGRVTEIW